MLQRNKVFSNPRYLTIKVTFISRDNERTTVDASVGDNLLSVGQAAGMPLEGTCEAQMACSTCHVIVAKEYFAKLAKAREEEEDMLDLAADVQATSRLSCQIDLTEELDGIEVQIPSESYNAQGF